MTSGLYKITLANNRYYFGSSLNLDNRHRQHYQDLVKGKHRNSIMQKSFDKYGIFEFKEIIHCDANDLMFYEQQLLDSFFNEELCVNLSPSAGTVRGIKHPVKTHCIRGHECNEQNTHVDKIGKKHCRVCARLRANPLGRLHGKDKTHCPQGHEYTEANTCKSDNKRHCLQCVRDRYYRKKTEGLVKEGRK